MRAVRVERGAGALARRLAAVEARGAVVTGVEPGSLAERLGLEPGDVLLSVDGQPLRDWLDYRYLITAEEVELAVRRADGRTERFVVCKDPDAGLGVHFASPVFDGVRLCHNSCVFCFLHQMPPGLRPSLYVPDDDYRLSFLHGNFVTLTNLSEADLDRIVAERISPLRVSVHATDPALRRRLMLNRRAGEVMAVLRRLASAGIELHCQLVLCPGWNDGEHLERSLRDLASLHPAVASVGVVPVGLTRFRAGLPELRPFTREEAAAVLDAVGHWQRRCRAELGTRLVHAADEFYVLAGKPVPVARAYEGFPQLENGIGLLRRFADRFAGRLRRLRRIGFVGATEPRRSVVVTGRSAAPRLRGLVERAGWADRVRVLGVVNSFFGPTVTVAGLLTGRDVVRALARVAARTGRVAAALPDVAAPDGRFLDGWTVADVARRCGLEVEVLPADGAALVDWLAGVRPPHGMVAAAGRRVPLVDVAAARTDG